MEDFGQAITRVIGTYKAAVYSRDVESFLGIYAPDVRVCDLWGERSYDGLIAWRRSVEGWFGSLGTEHVVVEVEVVRTHATRELAAVEAVFVYRAVSAGGEALRAMQNRLTWVLKPTGGEWKIDHEHTSAPIDPATMKVILDVVGPG